MYDATPKTPKIIPKDFSHFFGCIKKKIHANFYYIFLKMGILYFFFI